MKKLFIVLLISLIVGCRELPKGACYNVIGTNGWSSVSGYCHHYEIQTNKYILYDEDGKIVGELHFADGWTIIVKEI